MPKLYLHSNYLWSFLVACCLQLLVTSPATAQLTYSSTFSQSTTPSVAQAQDWVNFRNSLLAMHPYYKVKISSSISSTPVECNNPTIVQDIALKLRTGVAGTWTDGSNTWNVGSCGSSSAGTGWELSVNNGNCACGANPTVRPGIGNSNWGGGFGTTSCGAPTQVLTVEFFYVPPCDTPENITVTNLQKNSATVSWNPVSGTAGYEYFISNSSVPPTTGTVTSSTTVNLTGLTEGTDYYFHVRNECGDPVFSVWRTKPFTTPICFAIDTLKVGNVTDNSALVTWNSISIADHYEYILSQSSTPPVDGAGATIVPGNNAQLSGLSANTTYFFYVRSRCFAATDSSIWNMASFTTRAECLPPAVTVNNQNPGTPDLSWAAMPFAVGYEYAVTKTPTPPAAGITIYKTSISIPLPEGNQGAYFHVRTKCYDIFTMSGWATTILKEPTNIADINGMDGILQMHPNPVKDVLFIELSPTVAVDGRILITDIAGKVIYGSETREQMEIDTRKFTPGMYFLKYSDEARNATLKFIKE